MKPLALSLIPLLCWSVVAERSGRLSLTDDDRSRSQPGFVQMHLNLSEVQTDVSTPDVIVLEPKESRLTVRNDVLKLRALVRSYFPLKSLTVTLNGKTVQTISLGTRSNEERRRFLFESEVTLRPGENIIAIIANNEKVPSKPQIRTVNYLPTAESKPNLIVLAVGISKYDDPSLNSSFADDDAHAFAKIMSSQANDGGLYGEVKSRVLVNDQATRAAILEGLGWVNSVAKSDSDVRVVFLSGGLGLDYSYNPYFLSSEHRAKTDPAMTDVNYYLFWDRLTSRPGRTLIFVNPNLSGDGGSALAGLASKYSGGSNTYIASQEKERLIESANWGHSAFMKALLEGLGGRADLEMNGPKDGVIDTAELSIWLNKRVPDLTEGRQHPTFHSTRAVVPFFKLSTATPP